MCVGGGGGGGGEEEIYNIYIYVPNTTVTTRMITCSLKLMKGTTTVIQGNTQEQSHHQTDPALRWALL